MVKLKHWDNSGFSAHRYLVDMNPSKSIYGSEEYRINSFRLDQLKNALILKYSLKEIGKLMYNSDFTVSLYDNKGVAREYSLLYLNWTEDFNIKEFNTLLEEYKYVPEIKDLPKINFISLSDGECYLIEKNLPNKIDIDIDNSYNLSYSLDKIMSDIKSDKSGLILFTGIPGTGKSSLIKYLSQENQDKKFCFISNSNLDILSNPSFIEFCINNLQDSVVILEDCEKALLTRDMNKGYDISNILNLTDGIYGDVLNIKIIATLNTVDKIDTALLRKGRLICQSDFKKLTIEQGNNLAKKLNKNIEIKEELQICEIYNTEDNGNKISLSTQKVGFSM